MKAMFKTLFGDVTNMAFVGAVLILEFLLVHNGYARDTAFAMPPVLLIGMAWLATR